MRFPQIAPAMLLLLGLPLGSASAIQFGQLDDFQNGDVSGWVKGLSSLAPPTVVTEAENKYLTWSSFGRQGPDGRLVAFNQTQWIGNYVTAGVDRIRFDVKNTSGSATPLYVRIALGDSQTTFSSTTPVVVPDDGAWHAATFDLSATAMTRLFGTASLTSTLGNIEVIRILSAQSAPSFSGDSLAATISIDNILATFVPSIGDLNADRAVDASDAGIMFANWGQSGEGDLNADGVVDAADAGEMFAVWTGDAVPTTAAIPEPFTASSFLLGCAVALRWRIRGRQPRVV